MLLPEILKLSGGPALAPPTNDQMILEFDVPNMGCASSPTASGHVFYYDWY